jgi:phosphate transport system protein
MTTHVIKSYEEELDRLKAMVLAMGKLAHEQLALVVDAADRADVKLAEHVVEQEPQADHLEHQIDRLAIRLLALRQPVAVDLREILSALRIAAELERICDHAEDMARRLITALGGGRLDSTRSTVNLLRFAARMAQDALLAYADRNAALAQEVWDRDTVLDEMYSGLFRELLTYMMEDPRRISAAVQMLFIARDIERVGDRATNIAEMARYLGVGVPVEEERPKAATTKSMTVPGAT